MIGERIILNDVKILVNLVRAPHHIFTKTNSKQIKDVDLKKKAQNYKNARRKGMKQIYNCSLRKGFLSII